MAAAAAPGLITAFKTVSAVATTLSAIKGLTTKAPKMSSSDVVTTPTAMPTEDSQAVADAKRRALIAQTTRGGRASTVLTDSETFGGN